MVHQYVPSLYFINMFHQYNIPSRCSINIISHHYVPAICSITMFRHYIILTYSYYQLLQSPSFPDQLRGPAIRARSWWMAWELRCFWCTKLVGGKRFGLGKDGDLYQKYLDILDFFGDVTVTLWLCQNSYWKWPFIVDFPIKHGDFP